MMVCHVQPILFSALCFSRSQMVLSFRIYQMMYNASHVVVCAEVTCKGYFVIQ